MEKDYWTITEVKELFQIGDDFLELLEQENIICPQCDAQEQSKFFSNLDVEKVRLARILMEEMGVNLPGVEVILHLRQNMIDMRRQFDAILEDIAGVFREALRKYRQP